MQGKLIAEFVNKNRCISVRLVSEEVTSIEFDNLIIHIIVSYDTFEITFLALHPCFYFTRLLRRHFLSTILLNVTVLIISDFGGFFYSTLTV